MHGRSAPAPSRRGGGERFGSPAFFPNVECSSRFETAVCRKHGLRPGPEAVPRALRPRLSEGGAIRVRRAADSGRKQHRPETLIAPRIPSARKPASRNVSAGPAGRNRPAKPPADISSSDRRPESPVVGRKYTIRPSAAKAALGDPKAAFLAPWGRSSYTSASMRRISSAICGAVRRLARRSSCGSNRSANSLRAP